MSQSQREEMDCQKPLRPGNLRAGMAHLVLWFLSGEFKLLAGSLILVAFGLYELARQELSILSWENTQGTVIDSQTEWLEQKKGNFGPPLRVHIRYRYTV